MKRLEYLRREKRFSQRGLGSASGVCASDISKAERRGLVLYPCQAERMAHALDWEGDPMELFAEVDAS